MKVIQRNHLVGIFSVFIGLAAAKSADAQSFGVSFVGNTSDQVTGTAGVVPIGNWNNIAGATFTSGTILADNGSTTASLSLTGAATAGSWHSGATSDGGNGSLMDGYIDAGHNNGGGVSVVSTISGLTGSVYNIFIYNYSDATHPGNNGDYLSSYSINGISVFGAQLGGGTSSYDLTSTAVGGPFTGFIKETAFGANFNTAPNASDFGNYIEIDNVAPQNGVITIASESDINSWRSPLNGFEIVAATPEPTTLALSVGSLAMLGLIRRRYK